MTAAFGNTRNSCWLAVELALAGQLSSRLGLSVQERNASFRLQQIQELSHPQIIVQRRFLHFGDRTGIVLLQQFTNTFCRRFIEPQRQKLLSDLSAEGTSIWLDDFVQNVCFGKSEG